MVEREHIAYLVQSAFSRQMNMGAWLAGRLVECNQSAAMVRVANILSLANAASIEERYPDTKDAPENAPGDLETFEPWTASEIHKYDCAWLSTDPVQVIKAVDCYQYQACEAGTWLDSMAKEITDKLARIATHNLPGYDDAEWGSPKPASNYRNMTLLGRR